MKALAKWPLLIVGLALIGWAVALGHDTAEGRAFLLAVGAVLMGVGLTLVVEDATRGRGRREDEDVEPPAQ